MEVCDRVDHPIHHYRRRPSSYRKRTGARNIDLSPVAQIKALGLKRLGQNGDAEFFFVHKDYLLILS
jgi:hypothetical protein